MVGRFYRSRMQSLVNSRGGLRSARRALLGRRTPARALIRPCLNRQYAYTGNALVVTIPLPAGSGGAAAPTGIIFNATTDFVVTEGTNFGPSVFIFATEDGTIAGWNPTVDPTNAVIAADNSGDNALCKGAGRRQQRLREFPLRDQLRSRHGRGLRQEHRGRDGSR